MLVYENSSKLQKMPKAWKQANKDEPSPMI